jgi:hypothetical protein
VIPQEKFRQVEPEMSAIYLVATCPQEASRETAKAPEIVIKYLLTPIL